MPCVRKFFCISLVLVVLSGCGFPFRCESEQIEVSLPVVIERGTAQEEAALSGAVAPSNVGVDIFADLKRVLIEKPTAPSSGIVWSVPAFNTNGGRARCRSARADRVWRSDSCCE